MKYEEIPTNIKKIILEQKEMSLNPKEFNINIPLEYIVNNPELFNNDTEYEINTAIHNIYKMELFNEIDIKRIYNLCYTESNNGLNMSLTILKILEYFINEKEQKTLSALVGIELIKISKFLKRSYEEEDYQESVKEYKEQLKNEQKLRPQTYLQKPIIIEHKLYKDYYNTIKKHERFIGFTNYNKLKNSHKNYKTTKMIYEITIQIDNAEEYDPILINVYENKIFQLTKMKQLGFSLRNNILTLLFYNFDFKKNKMVYSKLLKKDLKILENTFNEIFRK
ncbi:MAG: hypothetical protein U9N59_02280 [Campylobacterota bacterium]|nr:hypothetical protein [Campylobacterota bacterium]